MRTGWIPSQVALFVKVGHDHRQSQSASTQPVTFRNLSIRFVRHPCALGIPVLPRNRQVAKILQSRGSAVIQRKIHVHFYDLRVKVVPIQ